MLKKYISCMVAACSILTLHASEEITDAACQDPFDNTELHYAMRACITAMPTLRYTHIDTICRLLHQGQLPTTKNVYGQTASEFATQYDTQHGTPLQDDEYALFVKGIKSELYKEWLKQNTNLKKQKKNTLLTSTNQIKKDTSIEKVPNGTHRRSISVDIPVDHTIASSLQVSPPLTPPAIVISYIAS